MTRPLGAEWSVLDRNNDPVPGDTAVIDEIRTAYEQLASVTQEAHDLLISGSRIDGGQGAAMEAFRELIGAVPKRLQGMATSYREAARALQTFEPSLTEAQAMSLRALEQAQEAVAAQASTAAALAGAEAAADAAGKATGDAAPDPAEVDQAKADVAAARDQQAQAQNGLDQAKALLGQAEALWQTAAGAAAGTLHELADDAPQRSLWDKIVDAFKAFIDFLVSTVMEWIVAILDVLATIAGFIFPPLGSAIGFLAGGLDVLRAAVSGNMAEIGLALAGLALGLVPGGRIAKRIIDVATDFLPGTVRGGAAGAGRGISAGGGRTVKAPLPTPGITPNRPPVPLDTSVSLDLRKCVTDPVDVATGEMVLSRVDVAVPVVERTHVSSYRAGGLFGPTWASTLDQRLETDAQGVCWFAPDGMILVYPAAGPGTAVLPEEGPRIPLTVLPDDRAEVRDPATGRVLRFRAGLLESIEEDGARLTVERDEEGLPTVLRHSSGPALSVTTSGGRITALHGPDQTEIAGYEYDGGRLTGARNASGKAEEYGYDEAGRVTSWRDRNGVGYRYTYDASGRCVATDGDEGFLSATFVYDVERRVTRFTDSLGQVRTYELDEWHHTIRETDPLGNTVTSEWDRHHRLLARTDALGGTTRYEYVDDTAAVRQIIRADGSVEPEPVRHEVTGRDVPRDPAAAGAVVAVTGPHGIAEQVRYDDEGNPVERTGAAGQVTRYEYGAFDLITAVVDPVGGRTEYRYDSELRLTGVTDPRGLTWSYGYDAAGRLVEERDFDGRVLGFTYDGAGRLVASANGLGEVREYVRDPLGAVVVTGTATYTYDWAGRLMSASDGESSLVIERDEHGRVIAQTTDGARMTFSYDTDGQAVHRRTPSGAQSMWRFDAADGPGSLTAGGHHTGFRHDAAGREVERRVDGVPVLGQSFGDGWLSEQRLPGAGRREFDRRGDGEVLRVRDEAAGTTEYALDPNGRVLTVTGPDFFESYRYDVAGNLVTASVAGDHGAFTYEGNRVTAAGRVRYGYDGQGRTTTRSVDGATWTYEWDGRDRLTGVRTPYGGHWRYAYDPLGRRISKQHDDGERVDFVWDGAVLVEQVHTGPDGRRRVTTWDHHPVTGHPVAQTSEGGFASIVTDAVGTPTELLGADGVPVWQQRASLWGQPLHGADPDGTPLRFPGQYFDAETGLHYNVFRYYDPVTGRYLSQDPLGLAPAPNPVAYVPNPLSAADPLGLAPTGKCGGTAGAGGIPARPDPGDIGTFDSIRSDRSPTPDRGEGSSTGPTTGASPRPPSPEPEDDIADLTPPPPPHPALAQPWNLATPRPGIFFHGSSVPPDVIFNQGLKSSANFDRTAPHYDLATHVHNAKGSGFVSTSGNPNVSYQFIRPSPGVAPLKVGKDTFPSREGYIYHVEPPKNTPLIHVPSQNLPADLERFRYQDEWSALDLIPPEHISGATRVAGYYAANPNGKGGITIALPPAGGSGRGTGLQQEYIPNPNYLKEPAP